MGQRTINRGILSAFETDHISPRTGQLTGIQSMHRQGCCRKRLDIQEPGYKGWCAQIGNLPNFEYEAVDAAGSLSLAGL
jgi:hypothetical protein